MNVIYVHCYVSKAHGLLHITSNDFEIRLEITVTLLGEIQVLIQLPCKLCITDS